jgi:cysteine desulfurase
LRGIAAGRKKAHFVTSTIEHSSIAATFNWLERDGFPVTRVPVDAQGRVDPDAIGAALTASTVLVSIQAANGEIGTIQEVGAIGRVCRDHGALFHTDAVQAYGQVPLDVKRDRIDLMSLSAHKIYGPKGIGALFVAADVRRRLRPQITGGDQQDGLRAGTVPTPLAVGFGRAATLAAEEGAMHHARMATLRDRLFARLSSKVSGVRLNGPRTGRLPGNLNLCIDGVDADSLLPMLRGIALSTGSACSAGALSVSPVLLAIGLPVAVAQTALRIGIGRTSTTVQIDEAVECIAQAVKNLRD